MTFLSKILIGVLAVTSSAAVAVTGGYVKNTFFEKKKEKPDQKSDDFYRQITAIDL
ncbi:hypothetical protein MSUIS_05480 [Mycoplasma suis KI3806]|uniref:Uncharacterized protein n=1 Tax=Mycoplasma suis (strain KI_3806) TaxID=708248 RepID=F0V1W0_MYCS3|nr:hypothetical protein [Mycoplasma suis]CBZ40641.1 hypothetical protein MSUIS_05480 [Mycoplasma suis KI3806]